jgi:DNA-directed RNA polymerase subunit beta'
MVLKKINFKNKIFSKKEIKEIIYESFTKYGIARTYLLADEIKNLGFNYATKAGISISLEDLKIPPNKKRLLIKSEKEIIKSDLAYVRGEITIVERFQNVINIWNQTSDTLKNNLVTYFSTTDPLNSIYLMAFSGARGNISQVRQLVGMRGLMSDPNGQIIEIPIIHNFREGLTITDYIMSAYGARKGVVDTALRTADSGYLTRRLIDVVQDVIIREYDCFTKYSIKIYLKEINIDQEKILGRTSAETIAFPNKNKKIISKGEIINKKIVENLILFEIKSIKIYSPLTCESIRSICQKCYGWDLSTCQIVKLGEAIGIIAAQSIGEPGTQLTMRTFHTGGIFTSDTSRQIRAKSTGFFYINKTASLKIERTIYGKIFNLLENETYFNIIDFNNIKISVKLPTHTLIFQPTESFIKEDDLIGELPHKNQQTRKTRKKIIAPHSGEITINNRKNIFWILNGEVYNIPNNSLINDFNATEKINEYNNLYQFKLKNKNAGFLKYKRNIFNNSAEIIDILNCLEIFKSIPIFYEKNSKKIILVFNLKTHYILNYLPEKLNQNEFLFAESIKTKYNTKIGGQLSFLNTFFFKNNLKYKIDIIKKSGKIFILPIEIYTVNKVKSLLLIENNTKLEDDNIELIPGLFSKTNGFVQIKESNQMIQEIQIKPCLFFEFINLNDFEILCLKKYDKKIYFPGEIIFEDIIVRNISYIEFLKIHNSYILLLRPLNIYNVKRPKKRNIKKKLLSFQFNYINSLKYKTDFNNENNNNILLVEENIWIETKSKLPNVYKIINISKNWECSKLNHKNYLEIGFKNNLTQNLTNNNKIYEWNSKQIYYLGFLDEEKFNITNILPKKTKIENFKLSLFFKNLEYIEEKNLIGKISYAIKNLSFLKKLKQIFNKNLKILLIKKENYINYYSEFDSFYKKKNEIIKFNDLLLPLIKVKNSGKIISKKPFKLILHKGTPFFISESIILSRSLDNFIKENELIGIIYFEQILTGDIIQGLPKIEEILEARKPQNPAFLNEFPSIVKKVTKDNIILYNKFNIINNNKIITPISSIVKKNDFVYIGQALTKGSINPHNLLMTYFTYYKNFTEDYESTYLSFKHIQMLLIEKIQDVYNLQGVPIADKHIEVIIKRITSKVQIHKSECSFLLPGEIIELQQISYINKVLEKSMKKNILYYPILLGITKCSLLSDSFISAASFQETTKILTAAAIEGKIDWLKGLKENVIIGRLIPAGTGFRNKLNL